MVMKIAYEPQVSNEELSIVKLKIDISSVFYVIQNQIHIVPEPLRVSLTAVQTSHPLPKMSHGMVLLQFTNLL